MHLRIQKAKLPKTLAYPMKSSFLEQIILESKFDIAKIEYVDYFPRKGYDYLFGAHYKGEKERQFASPGTINISIHAVPLPEYKRIKNDLTAIIANEFKQWLNSLEENLYELRDRSHGFHVWVRNNQVVVDK
ncbi:hypothetical protein [Chitinophaga caseinilytica]|uniref:Uncharacterized protein n=1 Tax=Chitinophaga caseinilytica TaxID=2267521 RepID=A0ABZ2Z685_9BACT